MTRLHTGTIPTSTLAATARVVDDFTTSQTDHSGITSSFTRAYTSTGIMQTATDGRDTTTWAYHPTAGVELCKTYADNSQVVKTYDAFNRLATETNARGQVATHSYDAATGLPVSSFYNDGSSARLYTYNILGQLVQVMDAAGLRHYSYNSYGQLTQESVVNYESGSEQVHTRSETYDALGRCCGYTLCTSKNDTQVVSIGYATDGRISAAGFMHGGVNRQFSYGYLSGSNLLHTLTQPNGITLTQSYEEHRDLLTGMQYHRGSTLVVGRSYSYDTLGRPTNRSTARQGSVKNDTFTHNDRSELTAATLGTDAYNYSYDNIGNRKTAQEAAEEATAYDANNLNQYTAIQTGEEAAFVPTFDADGNQTKVKTSTGIWDVSYNILNRPTSFVRTNADGTQTKITAAYDTHGRRVWKKVEEISADGTTATVTSHRLFLYRGYLQIASLDLTRTTLPAEHFILWDPTQPVATRPLAIRKNGTWYTYGWDLTKNICEVFGSDGYIKTAYTYTPYGAVTASGSVVQPIQWSSEYYDTELGLVYYNYRHYNPADGRWTGRDDIGEMHTLSVYAFIANNPTNFVDYLGLEADDGVSGFSATECERKLARKEIKAGQMPDNLLKKIGFHDYKVRFNLQTKKCTGCCEGTDKKGISKSVSLAIQIEGEAGASTLNIANLAEFRFGLYGRLGATGSIAGSCNSCSNKITRSGCINVYGEVGLIGRVSSSITSFDAGARGGVNVRASACVSVNSNQIQIKARACLSLRVRVWVGVKIWFFGKIDYNQEWQDQWCTPWGVIATF